MMWAMVLLGLLVGVVPLLAAAALVRYLSQSRDGRQGTSLRARAAAADAAGSDRLEGGRRPEARKAVAVRVRIMIAAAVWAGAALLAGAAMLFVASDEPKRQPAPPVAAVGGELFAATEPKAVPELRFVDGAGRPRTLADFRGKMVLLNLWATWCVPCRKEMPALDRVQARLGGPDFEVVALSIDRKGLPAVQAFYAELGLKALAIHVDGSGGAASQLGALGLPTTLLVDAQGNEVGRAVGPREWDSPAAVAEIGRRIGRASPASRAPQDHDLTLQ